MLSDSHPVAPNLAPHADVWSAARKDVVPPTSMTLGLLAMLVIVLDGPSSPLATVTVTPAATAASLAASIASWAPESSGQLSAPKDSLRMSTCATVTA